MASHINSCCIPPSKNQVVLRRESLIDLTSGSPPIFTSFTPTASHLDASSTYTRYITPRKRKANLSKQSIARLLISDFRTKEIIAEPVPQAKKLKKSKDIKETSTIENTDLHSHGEITLQKSRKIRKRKADTTTRAGSIRQIEGDAPCDQKAMPETTMPFDKLEEKEKISIVAKDEEFTRHRKLMYKRDKSLKKAEKFAEFAGKVEDEDEELVELHDLVPLSQPKLALGLPLPLSTGFLPGWLNSPTYVSATSTVKFQDLGLSAEVIKHLEGKGFIDAFAIQAAVLPLLLSKPTRQTGDLVVSAATGSGKTMAYILPMIKDISRFQVSRLRGLIVLPTRELVTQAKAVAEMCALAFSTNQRRVSIGTAEGSDAIQAEQAALMNYEYMYDPEISRTSLRKINSRWETKEDVEGGMESLLEEMPTSKLLGHTEHSVMKINILICTPGRLVEHMKSTPGFTVQDVNWVVVDEADKLLDQSFQQWLNMLMARVKATKVSNQQRLRKVILSATMTRDLGQLNRLELYRPKLVVLESLTQQVELNLSHVLPSLLLESAIKVEEDIFKPLYLMELLKRQHIIKTPQQSGLDDLPSDSSSSESDSSLVYDTYKPLPQLAEELNKTKSHDLRGVLIFTKSNETAVRLSRLLALLAPSSSSAIGVLTSTLPRSLRHRTLQSFVQGGLSILVASDLVSRGLDLPNLAHVINYDVPTSLTSYIHRIGRTARAGKGGHAWTLFNSSEGRWFWNEIGRNQSVQRPGGKVERVNIKKGSFNGKERILYEQALEKLGNEASVVASV